jgi:exonuclease III
VKTKQNIHNSLSLFHQNIRGLKYKIDKLTCTLASGDLSPHIICFSENHLCENNILMTKPNDYYLASNFARQSYTAGGVCTLIKLNLVSDVIHLTRYCIEKVIEACAAHIKVGSHSIILLCIYRSPSGNFGEFLGQLDLILKCLYKPKFETIICGDFNVNFLIDSSLVQQLNLLMQSYNMFHIVDFPTRTTKGSSTAIDNIFIDLSRINPFQIFSLTNRLSAHETQYLRLNNIFYCQTGNHSLVQKRLITQLYQLLLSY